jgi:hypothetical protein
MKKVIIKGILSGLVMGFALFLTGAVASRIIYGPQMVPEGKFTADQVNAFYFLWTKLAIGCFFGIVFTWIYSKVLPVLKIKGALGGLLFGFALWLVITLWSLSHPLVYESVANKNQLFWNIYTLGGFLAYGATIGAIFK